jgi:hypothetical protein
MDAYTHARDGKTNPKNLKDVSKKYVGKLFEDVTNMHVSLQLDKEAPPLSSLCHQL